MKAKLIQNEQEKSEVEQVVSLLAHKIRKGIATEEEIRLHKEGQYDLLIYDWGTESYQNAVPNMIAAQEEKRRSLIAPAPKKLPSAGSTEIVLDTSRPELTRRPGRFAV